MLNRLPKGCTRIKTLYQGAEAIVDLCEWMNIRVVVKTRIQKGYRVRELDEYVRRSRTIREASILSSAKKAGVETPFVYHVNPVEGWIIMSYVEGESLRNLQYSNDFPSLVNKLGSIVGMLHSAGLIHGDLTPANIIVSGDRLVLIDFGLGEYSSEIEKRAEDLYTLVSSLAPLPNCETLVKLFLEGYRSSTVESEKVEERLKEISIRGRYVERELRKRYGPPQPSGEK